MAIKNGSVNPSTGGDTPIKKRKYTLKPVKGIKKKADGTRAKKPWGNQRGIGEENNILPETEAQRKDREARMRNLRLDYGYLLCEGYAQALGSKVRYSKTSRERLIFAAFLALPECQGIDQKNLADTLGVHRNSLTNWKFEPLVQKARNEIMEKHFMQYTPKVLLSLVNHAQSTNQITGLGDPAMMKLFLQYIEKWQEKAEVDVTSGGAQIVWGLQPSQFVDQNKLPNQEEIEAEDSEEEIEEESVDE